LAAGNLTGQLTATGNNHDHHDQRRGFGHRRRARGGDCGQSIPALRPAAGCRAPLADAASQTIRSNLVKQYNDIITQITTTAQDASFNGINLLNGDSSS
jgi:hypothetical protein